MNNEEIKKVLDIVDEQLKKEGISRRDAFKMMGLGTTGLLAGGGTAAQAVTTANASEAKGKIVIIGGGMAGIASAARLANNLSNPDITVIEPNPKSVSYQPGHTLVAAGIYTPEEIDYNTKDFVPDGVKLIKARAVDFNPEANKVVLDNGETISYDFLVIAAGLTLNFGAIKGLEEIGETYSASNGDKIQDVFKDSGLTSVYNMYSAAETWKQMQKFIDRAKSGEKVKAVYTQPNTAIKCGGAPKKIMFLTNSRLNEAGARENAQLTLYPNGGKMFGIPEYAKAIEEQFKARDLKWHFHHNLTAVDLDKKIATFDKHWKEKGEFDEDLEEYTMVTKHENVEVPFDFLHITPPMKAPDEIGNSSIGSSKGWVPVHKETLQHVKYPNIFALGDIAAVPMGKTGGSVRKQYKVLVDNLISLMEGKELSAKYHGYTVCPLITDIGEVMLAEFNWTKKPTPTLPLDPTQSRWMWWFFKVYLLKPMTMYGLLAGRA